MQEAIYAYTMGSAKANGSADKNGSITVNKHADFIVLNKKLERSITEDEDVHVAATYINGEEVYIPNAKAEN